MGLCWLLGFLIVQKVFSKNYIVQFKVLKFLNKTIFDRVDGNPSSFQEIFVHCVNMRIGFFHYEATRGNAKKVRKILIFHIGLVCLFIGEIV